MEQLLNTILDRWAIVAFLLGAASSILYNKARKQFQLEQLTQSHLNFAAQLALLKTELDDTKMKIAHGDTQFAVISANIDYLKAGIARIETMISRKD